MGMRDTLRVAGNKCQPPNEAVPEKKTMNNQGPTSGATGRNVPADLSDRILAEPEAAGILRALAGSTGLTVSLEEVSPAPGEHGPPCQRMSRLGPRRISGCEKRRSGLLGQVAGTGSSAAINCPDGTFCLAVPVYAQGIQVATLRASGFTKKMGASKERADAVRSLLTLASDELGRRAASTLTRPRPGSAAVRQALDHIHAHSFKPIPMEKLTAVAGVSRQYLAKIWKKQVGVPLNGYLIAIRIERAKVLLEAGNRKIIDVAMESGFGSLSQFNRAFLRATGDSPSRWLARNR